MSVPFLHVVADYGPGDLAFSEMISALAAQLPPAARWHVTPVGSFNTLSTGFIVAQLALQRPKLRPNPMLIYANCAPRQDEAGQRQDNAGESLVYVRLDNDVEVVAVNSGFSLSFLRGRVQEFHRLQVGDSGSQFRSRDLFPEVVAEFARGHRQRLGGKLDPEKIPAVPKSVIAYVDSFENLKTTLRQGQPELEALQAGQTVTIQMNGVTRQARVAGGSFEVPDGMIALAPGSSGHERPFWEIFRRGGSARAEFGSPAVGCPMEWKLSQQ